LAGEDRHTANGKVLQRRFYQALAQHVYPIRSNEIVCGKDIMRKGDVLDIKWEKKRKRNLCGGIRLISSCFSDGLNWISSAKGNIASSLNAFSTIHSFPSEIKSSRENERTKEMGGQEGKCSCV
jgi:hypothetical protein